MRVSILIAVIILAGCAVNNIGINEVNTMKLTSPEFSNNANIPSKFTCDGLGINPELNIDGIPANAKSLVLIVDDPDAVIGTFNHWLSWNIEITNKIGENESKGIQGLNGAKKAGYIGPCPPTGKHRYIFKVYALDAKLELKENASKAEVEKAMKPHIIDSAQLIGLYQRTK